MSKNRYARRHFLSDIGIGTAALAATGCAATARRFGVTGVDQRPNIVLIMSDDMGFSDLGCYGGEIQTPNLDALAHDGLRFTQFYNTARCCPSRASLLTGLYSHQTGVGHMMEDRGLQGYRGDLNCNCVTIADVLGASGYSTYMAGKWHVTPFKAPEGPKHNWPLQRGFDRFFGTIHGGGSFYDPNSLTLDNTMIPSWQGFYYTDAISDYAVRFINEHDSEAPLFLYTTYTAAHWPMHAHPEDIVRYRGRYDHGWDELRRERHARLKRIGLVDPQWPLTLRDTQVPRWEDEPMKDWQARRMEVYAAMVESMDRGIGRIVQALEARGQLDNTLFLFLQDNGGCAEEYGSLGPEKPDPADPVVLKPMAPGELQPHMQPRVTRDGRPVRTGKGVMPGPDDTFIAYGKGWANASNTPFRLYKHWVHEGGIATPLIVHWPERVQHAGAFRNQPGHLIDIMATCVDAAGARYPSRCQGERIIPMEGTSLVPAFSGELLEREAIYWEHEGNRAVRSGRWKLVSTPKQLRTVSDDDLKAWELYDLEADRTEMSDLAATYPGKVTQLEHLWSEWARRSHVFPWPWDPR